MADIETQKQIINELKPLIDKLIDERVKNSKKIKPMQVYDIKENQGQTTIKLVEIGDYDFTKNIFINNNAMPLEIISDSRYTYNKGDFVNIEWAYSLNNAKVEENEQINLNQGFFFEIVSGNLILNYFEWEQSFTQLKFSINEQNELICDYGEFGKPNLVIDTKGRLIYNY